MLPFDMVKCLYCYMQAVVARGGKFLEAPLIGDKALADEGRLIILAAGDQSVYDDCASCFEAIGKKFYLGLLNCIFSLYLETPMFSLIT